MTDGAAGSGSERPLSLELARVCVAPEGAFGVLVAGGIPAGPVTLERTYPIDDLRPRGPQFVKIPAGSYVCRRTMFVRGGYQTYEVCDVPGHSRLLFHRGNVEGDTEGCILLGMRFGLVHGTPAILESAIAFAVFQRLVGDRSCFELTVRAVL